MTSLYIIESGLIHALKPQAATITNLRASESFRCTRHPPSSTIIDATMEFPLWFLKVIISCYVPCVIYVPLLKNSVLEMPL
jgi:hypothetical protein